MAGIYIHIPFCRQACTYCNFHFSTSLGQKDALLNALHKEIIITAGQAAVKKQVETVYIGGGTPSLLLPDEISELIKAIQLHFFVLPLAEITLEANPDDINEPLLQYWLAAGVNRLSVGIQSFKEEELKWMNRAHSATQAITSINQVIDAGFTNFSVDLIYGSPLQSTSDLKQHIQYIIDKGIPHISAYALTVEPKTKLNQLINKKIVLPIDEEIQAEQFEVLVRMLQAAGYEQYEISNFAKPGFRSRHNSSYWQGKPYFGFGPAAHSYNGKNIRRWNLANNSLYIQSLEKNIIPFEDERLSETQRLNEYIMISLRTMEGIDLSVISKEFGSDSANVILKTAEPYIANGRVTVKENRIILTESGKFFADGIAADLFT